MEREDLVKERIVRMGNAGIDLIIKGEQELVVLIEGEKTYVTTSSLLDSKGKLPKALGVNIYRNHELKRVNPHGLHVLRGSSTMGLFQLDLTDGSSYIFYRDFLELNLMRRLKDEGIRIRYPV